jgi:hypothetical protein
MLVAPLHSQEKSTSDSGPQSISSARVADHESLLRIDLGSYLKLVFPANTFSENTAVKAHLDLERRLLRIVTHGEEVARTFAQIRVALPNLKEGLQIVYDHQTDEGSWFDGTLIDQAVEPLPQVVALTESGLEPVALDDDTVIQLSENRQRAQRVRWSALAYGDHIRVRYGKGRQASTIEAVRVSGEGVVDQAADGRLTLVGSTTPLKISHHARLQENDGQPMDFDSLRPDDRIALRIEPQTREIWHLTRLSEPPVDKPQLVVTHDGTTPLLPGDRVRITGTGTVESGLRAEELIGEPGTYVLTYTIPRGIALDDTPIVARLDLPDGSSHTVLAELPLVFTAAGAAAVPGDIADQEKPKAPVITSPNDGDRIKDTITVTGYAAPNQKVRVVIDFAVVRSIVMLGEGRLVEKELMTNSKGAFTTDEIPADVPRLFGGDRHYQITVIAIGSGGTESDPASMRVQWPD